LGRPPWNLRRNRSNRDLGGAARGLSSEGLARAAPPVPPTTETNVYAVGFANFAASKSNRPAAVFDCPGSFRRLEQIRQYPVLEAIDCIGCVDVGAAQRQQIAPRIRCSCAGRHTVITDSQTPAADHRPQRASHHGHLTDPDKEPTAAIVNPSRMTYGDGWRQNFR
jgi:hypothetical protein